VSVVEVRVPGTAERGYSVIVEPGGLVRLGELCAERAPAHRYAVIADSRVAQLYGGAALAALASAGLDADLLPFPAGEWNKSREAWAELSDAMLARGLGRDAVVVALGGGVTGDLAGFVAATFMRGVPVVQVPTTLLAMLDSSVGGKTGVDTHAAKNAIGAFHHPELVLVDPALLATLPPFQRRSGLAEGVKVAAMRDAELFGWIEQRAAGLAGGEPTAVAGLIERGVALKAEVVAEDPLERGTRAILNFGHTVGHALESLSGFSLLHGEAVALGMWLEARVGESLGITEEGTAGRLRAVLAACGLPEEIDPDWTARAILEAARPDKKARGGEPRWALPARIGAAALDAEGRPTHAIPAGTCARVLAAALRSASEVPDSPA
jgi:3-dehydroquinate synthase